jgi:hypothetical protein
LQPSVSCRLRYMSRFVWSHHWRARARSKHAGKISSYIVSHQTRTTICSCLNKNVSVYVFAKRRPAQKLPWRWRGWRTGHCCRSSSVSPPAPRWRYNPRYSSRRTHATWRVPMTLGWAAKRSAPRAHQRGSTPGRCTTECAIPLHTSCSRTLTQRQQRPSSDAVSRTTRESSTLATTMRPPCLTMDSAVQLLWTASKRRLRGSLSYTAAHATT